MRAYLLSVMGTVLLSALITAIIPEGKTAATIKGVARLICLVAIVLPVLNFLQSGNLDSGKYSETFFSGSVIQSDKEFIQYCSELRIQSAESEIEKELSEDFSLLAEVDIAWTYQEASENGTLQADRIKIERITVKSKTEIDKEEAEKVWEHLTKNYCSEVLIE